MEKGHLPWSDFMVHGVKPALISLVVMAAPEHKEIEKLKMKA